MQLLKWRVAYGFASNDEVGNGLAVFVVAYLLQPGTGHMGQAHGIRAVTSKYRASVSVSRGRWSRALRLGTNSVQAYRSLGVLLGIGGMSPCNSEEVHVLPKHVDKKVAALRLNELGVVLTSSRR